MRSVAPVLREFQWLALAGMAPLFTRKSHAARVCACNALIRHDECLLSDIFDSHRRVHQVVDSADIGLNLN
jgi:hypothetical protein